MRAADRIELARLGLAALIGAILGVFAWRRASAAPPSEQPALPLEPEAPPSETPGLAAIIALMCVGLAIGAGLAAWSLFERRENAHATAVRLTRGSPERGRVVLTRFGCGGCHEIPGIAGARGQVGPPLATVAARGYIAGRAPNGPETMIRFIHDPPSIDPGTAMPATGISEAEARDAAAYLYSLR